MGKTATEPSRLRLVRTLQDEITVRQQQIAAIQQRCQHDWQAVDEPRPSNLSLLDGIYEGQDAFKFERQCRHCDLTEAVTDLHFCPACGAPIDPGVVLCGEVFHPPWPTLVLRNPPPVRPDDLWLVRLVICSRRCGYGRVWPMWRARSHG